MALYVPTNIDDRADLLRWAEERLPYAGNGFDREKAQPIGVVRDGQLVAVAIYEHRRAATVEMGGTSISSRWATPATVAALLAWPFTALGVQRITAIIPARNKPSKRLAHRVGFKCEGRLYRWFPDDDAMIYGLTRDTFERSRWWPLVQPPAAAKAA